ncbi:MAG: hypothetical protein QW474_02205 [Candidatus Aenigmatarchaeota archaeon]
MKIDYKKRIKYLLRRVKRKRTIFFLKKIKHYKKYSKKINSLFYYYSNKEKKEEQKKLKIKKLIEEVFTKIEKFEFVYYVDLTNQKSNSFASVEVSYIGIKKNESDLDFAFIELIKYFNWRNYKVRKGVEKTDKKLKSYSVKSDIIEDKIKEKWEEELERRGLL